MLSGKTQFESKSVKQTFIDLTFTFLHFFENVSFVLYLFGGQKPMLWHIFFLKYELK